MPKNEKATTTKSDEAYLSVYLPAELKNRFRVQCAHDNASMSAKIVELIEAYVDGR